MLAVKRAPASLKRAIARAYALDPAAGLRHVFHDVTPAGSYKVGDTYDGNKR